MALFIKYLFFKINAIKGSYLDSFWEERASRVSEGKISTEMKSWLLTQNSMQHPSFLNFIFLIFRVYPAQSKESGSDILRGLLLFFAWGQTLFPFYCCKTTMCPKKVKGIPTG